MPSQMDVAIPEESEARKSIRDQHGYLGEQLMNGASLIDALVTRSMREAKRYAVAVCTQRAADASSQTVLRAAQFTTEEQGICFIFCVDGGSQGRARRASPRAVPDGASTLWWWCLGGERRESQGQARGGVEVRFVHVHSWSEDTTVMAIDDLSEKLVQKTKHSLRSNVPLHDLNVKFLSQGLGDLCSHLLQDGTNFKMFLPGKGRT